jgi:CheY-like chemotaxis protein
MQLEYRILWFEDQPGANIKPYEDNIRNGLVRLGFEPKITMWSGGADPMANLPPQQQVDIVLMDWKLGGSLDGADLSRKVRMVYRDTDIVFYSSEPAQTLRELIFKQNIDGVYCCNRTGLSDRTLGIIRAQMRKILDLNHMRGIVMAVTSDLDHAMIECLDVVQQVAYPGAADAFAAAIGVQIADGLRSKATEIEELGRKGKLKRLLKEPAFGPAMRLVSLRAELQKLADRINETDLLERLGQYHEDVITPRNDFAHRRTVISGELLTLEGRAQPFNQESMIALRLRLLTHADNLRALLSLLREMATVAGQPGLAGGIAAVERAVEQVEGAAGRV